MGGGADARFWAAAGGEGGVGSSHASWLRATNFCLRGGGGDVSARGEGREEGGYRTTKKWVRIDNIFLPDWNEVKAARSPSPMIFPQSIFSLHTR